MNFTRLTRWCTLALALAAGSAQAQNFIVGDGGTLLRTTDRGAHWKNQRTGQNYNLYTIHQVSKDTIIAAGELSKVLRSTNGSSLAVTAGQGGNNHDFSEIGFYTPQRGELYSRDFRGTATNAYRTTDGGANWTDAGFNNGAYAYGLQILNSQQAYRLASNTVARTVDQGANWTDLFAPTVFRSVASFQDSIAVIVGEQGVAYRTTNTGANWTRVNLGTSQRLNYVAVSPSGKEWIITGNNGFARMSKDTGRTWMPVTIPGGTPQLNDAWFVDSARVLIAATSLGGTQTLFASADTGTTFTRVSVDSLQNSGTNSPLISISFLDRNFGLLAGGNDRNRLYRTTNGGLSWGQISTANLNSGNRDIQAIGIFSRDTFVVGYAGPYGAYQVFRTVDGGQNFTEIILRTSASQSDNNLRTQIWRVSNTEAYMTAYGGRVWRTTDAGASWTFQQLDPNGAALNFIYNGWIVGADGKVFHTTDYQTYSPSYPLGYNLGALRALYAVDYDTLYVAGLNGLILKSTDAGASWNYIANPAFTDNLIRMSFSSKDTGVAVGAGGAILRTTDGGRSWMRMRPVTAQLNDVKFLNKMDGLIAGNSGTILRTNDAGATWTQVYSGVNSNLNRISFSDTLNQPHTLAAIMPYADTVRGYRNTTVSVPVRLRQFPALMGLRSGLSWDTAVARYNNVTPVITGLTAANFDLTQSANGRISFNWTRLRTQGVAGLSDTTIVFRLLLNVRGNVGDSTAINFNGLMGAADTTGATRDLMATAGLLRVVANPVITTGTPTLTTVCVGRTARVPFTVTGGNFLSPNTFTVQLSDSSGSFAGTVTNVGNRTGVGSDSITITIPAATIPGNNYQIRVVSTNPGVNGSSMNLAIAPIPAQPVISASGPTQICNGDSVILNAPAGFASYTWSNGATTPSITVKAGGNFNVRVTSAAGCQSVASANQLVTVQGLPTATTITMTGSTTGVICQGDSVTLTAANATGPWLWSTGATTRAIIVKAAGDYSVRVRSTQGCLSAPSAARSITVNPRPVAPAIMQGGNDTIKVVNPVAGGVYRWTRNGTVITGQTGPWVLGGANSGRYRAQLVDGGCTSDTSINVVYTNLLKRLANVGVSLYPNPAKTMATMQFDGLNTVAQLVMTDALGREVKRFALAAGATEQQIPVAELSAGIYMLHLQTEAGTAVYRLRVE